MSEGSIGMRGAEIATAAGLFAFGAVVVADSVRIGRGWAADGPEAGFYPFYVGLTLCACSAWIGVSHWRSAPVPAARFVSASEARRVLLVLVPSTLFVAALFWLGTYVSSLLFLTGFMRWLGKYAWHKAALIGFGVSLALFLLFEMWFQVPLPKGPLEAWLGY
jgi:putative tricarboxylic transport membrane protein